MGRRKEADPARDGHYSERDGAPAENDGAGTSGPTGAGDAKVNAYSAPRATCGKKAEPPRISTKAFIIATTVLVMVLVVVATFLYEKPELDEGWTVEVSGEVDSPNKFNMTELMGLPSVDEALVLKGTGEDGEVHMFTGVPLHTILDICEVRDGAQTVRIWAKDNYAKSFPLDSVLGRNDVLVAYAIDGEPIPGSEDGGNGPVRLIVSQDFAEDEFNAQHCVKFVIKVTVE